jgi:hypothetical protein
MAGEIVKPEVAGVGAELGGMVFWSRAASLGVRNHVCVRSEVKSYSLLLRGSGISLGLLATLLTTTIRVLRAFSLGFWLDTHHRCSF